MECYGIKRAFQHKDVRIGWYPYVATKTTTIRSNPLTGSDLKVVGKGGGLGYQSVRNPLGDPNPPRRLPATIDGVAYAWVYARAGDITGWIPLADIGVDPNSASKPALDGPGGYDFEVGRTLPLEKKSNSCGKISLTRPLRVVTAREVYLRYSPRGTAFHFLHEGDVVKLLLVNAEKGSYAFVEIVASRQGSPARPGTRGWIWQNALGPIPPENSGP